MEKLLTWEDRNGALVPHLRKDLVFLGMGTTKHPCAHCQAPGALREYWTGETSFRFCSLWCARMFKAGGARL